MVTTTNSTGTVPSVKRRIHFMFQAYGYLAAGDPEDVGLLYSKSGLDAPSISEIRKYSNHVQFQIQAKGFVVTAFALQTVDPETRVIDGNTTLSALNEYYEHFPEGPATLEQSRVARFPSKACVA